MRVARAGRAKELQDMATVDVRGPIESMDGLPLLVLIPPPRRRRPDPIALRARLSHLRRQTQPALRRRRAIVTEHHRDHLLLLSLGFRKAVRPQEVPLLR